MDETASPAGAPLRYEATRYSAGSATGSSVREALPLSPSTSASHSTDANTDMGFSRGEAIRCSEKEAADVAEWLSHHCEYDQ